MYHTCLLKQVLYTGVVAGGSGGGQRGGYIFIVTKLAVP